VNHYTSQNNPYYIYALIDPRDQEVRYIGITTSLYTRFKQHMHCDGTNVSKDAWIQDVLASGHLIIMQTLEQVGTLKEALHHEKQLIWNYLSDGSRLLNIIVRKQFVHKQGPHYGRKYNYAKVREIILHRYVHGTWFTGLSVDMRKHYEFNYFTKPKRSEKEKNPKMYAQHVKSYERGRAWIAELKEKG